MEIDETCFSHKPKHHRGHAPHTPIWVLVDIVDTSTSPAIGYLKMVERKDAATLLPIILKVVRQGSVIPAMNGKHTAISKVLHTAIEL